MTAPGYVADRARVRRCPKDTLAREIQRSENGGLRKCRPVANSDKVPIFSKCPICREIRVTAYNRNELVERLRDPEAIELSCEVCRETWPLTMGERKAVAGGLLKGK